MIRNEEVHLEVFESNRLKLFINKEFIRRASLRPALAPRERGRPEGAALCVAPRNERGVGVGGSRVKEGLHPPLAGNAAARQTAFYRHLNMWPGYGPSVSRPPGKACSP